MSGGGGEEGETLEFTPTWVVAAVCTVIVAISLAAERLLHYGGKFLKSKDQKPLYEALQKIKEELMLLGFISLLLTVSQNGITKICVRPSLTRHMLPCNLHAAPANHESHFQTFSPGAATRRLAAEHSTPESPSKIGYCALKNKVPLLSVEALHHLHIFIFVLAVVHVTFSVLTVVFGGARIRQWKHWEDSIAKQNYETDRVLKPKVTQVHQHDFIRGRFAGFGKDSAIVGWLLSFLKQFYGSVTKSDYVTLRHGFIMTHCRTNPKFNFHKYMIRALEDDFKQVVGISWYLWLFVVIFLLLNINGWHTYFWIAFIPVILLVISKKMSANGDFVRIVLYHNGCKTESRRGVVFEGEKRGTRIKRNSTIDELHGKISQKLGLEGNQRISMVTARIWSDDKYISMKVIDDEDVEFVIGEFLNQARKNFLELYVDFVGVEDVALPIRSVQFNYSGGASASACAGPVQFNYCGGASASAAPIVNLSMEDENDPTWVMDDDDIDDDDDENIAMEDRLIAENASASDDCPSRPAT